MKERERKWTEIDGTERQTHCSFAGVTHLGGERERERESEQAGGERERQRKKERAGER